MDNAHTAVTLLPCPFCGGEASDAGHARYSKPLPDTWWEDGSEITECFFVNCVKCGISNGRRGLVDGYQTRAEAIAAWNTRATTADLQARLEASEAECFKLAASVCIAEAVNAELVEGLERIEYQSTNHGGWFDQNGQQFAEYCKLGDIARQALTTTRNADAQGGG